MKLWKLVSYGLLVSCLLVVLNRLCRCLCVVVWIVLYWFLLVMNLFGVNSGEKVGCMLELMKVS